MARLATMKPGLAVSSGRLLASPSTFGAPELRRQEPWRAWYGLKRWKDIRWSVLVRDLFTCQLCGHLESNTALLVCDHITAHRGNPDLFWNGPFETLCQQCHSIEKQSQESGTTAQYHPDWLRPSSIPLTLVCGPTGAGKSTYAQQHAKPYDVIIDMDVIASGLSGQPLHTWGRDRWLQPALRKRNAMLAYLSRKPRWHNAWFIVSEPKAEHREWWHKRLMPQAIVVLATPADVCMQRAAMDADRDQQRTINAIEAWWRDYSPSHLDVCIAT